MCVCVCVRFLLGVESVVALGAGETALPAGRSAIGPSGRRRPGALPLMGVQVGSPGEGGEALGARKRPFPRVTSDVIPQRHFGERPLANGAGVLGQRLGGARLLPLVRHGAGVESLVEDELRLGIGRETALPAPPPLALLPFRHSTVLLLLLVALVLPRVPGHVLGQGEQRAAPRTSGKVTFARTNEITRS